jgi:hypothetical protein
MDQYYLNDHGDRSYSILKGNYAEMEYEKKLKARHLKYRAATRMEQQYHWDYIINPENRGDDETTVEVKSAKSKNKFEVAAWDYIVLELHGKQSYNKGWLRGSAAFIAFHQADGSFIHFNRKSLLEWIIEALKEKKGTIPQLKGTDPQDYQLYWRTGNKLERFCYVPLKDIPLKKIILK